jgi:hypothetical protein
MGPREAPVRVPNNRLLMVAELTPCKISPPQGDPQGYTFVSIPIILDQHSVVDPVRSCSSLRAGPVPAWRSTLPPYPSPLLGNRTIRTPGRTGGPRGGLTGHGPNLQRRWTTVTRRAPSVLLRRAARDVMPPRASPGGLRFLFHREPAMNAGVSPTTVLDLGAGKVSEGTAAHDLQAGGGPRGRSRRVRRGRPIHHI